MQNNLFGLYSDMFQCASEVVNRYSKATPKFMKAVLDQTEAVQTYWTGVVRYVSDFMAPSWNAFNSFVQAESEKVPLYSPAENVRDYEDLFRFNTKLARDGFLAGFVEMNKFFTDKVSQSYAGWMDALSGKNGNEIDNTANRHKKLANVLVHGYPKAIKAVDSEYGFHFENGGYIKFAETERFELYQVLPQDKHVQVREDGKPIIIIPPYVLGGNILAFLPEERRSYVHCFANQGIPTFVRLVKDIDTTPAVQVMSGEDDALDTRYFAELLKKKYNKLVTLNGFCQGGYHSVINILSGELDGLVDALITCAAPMDGSRSKSLVQYMNSLPPRFRDIRYALKTLPNGNKVVDGQIMAWVYRLRRMETESPLVTFHRDLSLFEAQKGPEMKISKTAAAINYWTTYERTDLPYGITKIAFDSYSNPVAEDGTLPVTLFGRKLNFKHIRELNIPWLICIADKDDLVDKEASLAPLQFVDAEVTVFPKGHASIATSWSIPASQCAMNLCFCVPGASPDQVYRGPVRFQLDMEERLKGEPDKVEAAETAVGELPEGHSTAARKSKKSVAKHRKKKELVS